MAEELEEVMGITPIERVWRAFDEVEENEKEKEVRGEEAEQPEWEKERGIRVELATAENEKTAERIRLDRKGSCEQWQEEETGRRVAETSMRHQAVQRQAELAERREERQAEKRRIGPREDQEGNRKNPGRGQAGGTKGRESERTKGK